MTPPVRHSEEPNPDGPPRARPSALENGLCRCRRVSPPTFSVYRGEALTSTLPIQVDAELLAWLFESKESISKTPCCRIRSADNDLFKKFFVLSPFVALDEIFEIVVNERISRCEVSEIVEHQRRHIVQCCD
jgi:hypothetical protein